MEGNKVYKCFWVHVSMIINCKIKNNVENTRVDRIIETCMHKHMNLISATFFSKNTKNGPYDVTSSGMKHLRPNCPAQRTTQHDSIQPSALQIFTTISIQRELFTKCRSIRSDELIHKKHDILFIGG